MGFGHWPELLVILIVALIVFGPQKLPEVGSAVGKGLREFRRATTEIEDAVLHPEAVEEPEEDIFPHIPPDPDPAIDDAADVSVTPTIDTLAQRRAARMAAGQEREPTEGAADPKTTPS